MIKEAKPLLRMAIRSADYLLAAKSMVSLARMNDEQSVVEIERAMESSTNPLVIIHAAAALKMLGSPDSLHVLIDALRNRQLPHYAADEIILAIAGLLRIEQWFYPRYSTFLSNAQEAIEQLEDYQVECAAGAQPTRMPVFGSTAQTQDMPVTSAVEQLINGEPEAIGGAAEALAELHRRTGNSAFDSMQLLLEIAAVQDTAAIRFLIAATIVHFGCQVD
jgi:HEAT repeat protein